MKAKVGVELWIDFAHSLRGHRKCEPKHGHTARVVIEVEGELKGGDALEGHMVMDFDDLKRISKEAVAELDHRDLDEVFEFPTIENVAKRIFEKLCEMGVGVCRVTVYEGEGKWCTIER